MKNNLNLIPGKPYMVKYRGGNKKVRRIYKGEEVGVCDMKRFVFSSKVNKNVYAEVEVQTDKDGQPTGVRFFKWKNTQNVPAQEVSIPHYDLLQVESIN